MTAGSGVDVDLLRAAARRLGLVDAVVEQVADVAPRDTRCPGPVLVACDLDRTVIYSAAALALDGPDAQAPALVVAEVYRGVPQSFLTRTAGQLLAALAGVALVVPTTTRTMAQYARVRLGERPPVFAVTSNGGHILVDGVPDPDWADRTAALLAGDCAPLTEVAVRMGALSWLRRLRTADDLFCYAVVDRAALPGSVLGELTARCAEAGWTVSVQGRKLYCVPRLLTKSAAVAEVRRRTGSRGVAAAGDSLLDADLLAYADAAVRPAHGELHDAGWWVPGLEVTAQRGVRGGEELLARLLAAVLAGAPQIDTGAPQIDTGAPQIDTGLSRLSKDTKC